MKERKEKKVKPVSYTFPWKINVSKIKRIFNMANYVETIQAHQPPWCFPL